VTHPQHKKKSALQEFSIKQKRYVQQPELVPEDLFIGKIGIQLLTWNKAALTHKLTSFYDDSLYGIPNDRVGTIR
jgi:hypothetical protein